MRQKRSSMMDIIELDVYRHDIYSPDFVEDEVEDDLISMEEAAFMKGYLST